MTSTAQGLKAVTTVWSQQGQHYDLHVRLTSFPTLREQNNQKSSTCSRANISHAQNTQLYDSCNQAAACDSREERRALRRNVPKGPLVLLYCSNTILEASEVLNLGTWRCGCNTMSLYRVSCNWYVTKFYIPKLTLSLVQNRCIPTRGTVASWHIAAGCTAHQCDPCQDTICPGWLFRIHIPLQEDLTWGIVTLTGRWRQRTGSHVNQTITANLMYSWSHPNDGRFWSFRAHHPGEAPHHPSAARSTADPLIPSTSIQGRYRALPCPTRLTPASKKHPLCTKGMTYWTGRDLHRKARSGLWFWRTITEHNKAQGLAPKWGCLLLLSGAGDPVQTPAWAALTRDAGDAEHVSVADSELVHHCARLVGINYHDFTGWQRASEDPDTAGCGIHLMELLCLRDSRHAWAWSALLLDQPELNSAWQHLHMV